MMRELVKAAANLGMQPAIQSKAKSAMAIEKFCMLVAKKAGLSINDWQCCGRSLGKRTANAGTIFVPNVIKVRRPGSEVRNCCGTNNTDIGKPVRSVGCGSLARRSQSIGRTDSFIRVSDNTIRKQTKGYNNADTAKNWLERTRTNLIESACKQIVASRLMLTRALDFIWRNCHHQSQSRLAQQNLGQFETDLFQFIPHPPTNFE